MNQALTEVQKERLNLEATATAISTALKDGRDLRQHIENLGEFPGRELIENALGVSNGHVASVSALEKKLFDDQNQLKSYAQFYGPEHPKVVQLADSIDSTRVYLEDLRQQAIQALTPERRREIGDSLLSVAAEKVAQAMAHENGLLTKFAEAESEAVQLNDQQVQLAFVNHELDRLRSLHDTLLERMSTIEIKQDHADVTVSVTEDPEASPNPVSPNLKKTVVSSLFLGCAFGFLIVYVLDRLEDRFRTPEELRDQLGAPLLAVVRDIPDFEGDGLDALQVHVSPNAVESEAFRTLRTSLTFSHKDRKILSVTSPEPSDGKTTVIANLAASFAQAGRRTLLIDADLRKPGLSRLFGVRGLGGLTEVLRSDESIIHMAKQRIRNTDLDCLDLLPCGPKPSDPTVLLEMPRLEDLFAWAESQYDQVLVDCPPIMAASDASLIGRLTSGILIVVQPDKTHRRLVLRSVENLKSLHVPIVGLVANRIKQQSGDGYSGYGYGYGYGYGNGYGADDASDTFEHANETVKRDRKAA
ncbi:MAG: polysaccharide biosynthesis tyrosine autokinase [Pirellulaceae bacterium]|nr:polysaccharide biosynthesis tyrosine autokinase [Pirellulaceae bacterium]